MKTYHMYHSETLSAENKLKEAERQGERQGRGGEAVFSLRTEDRHQRRNAARKIQKMKEKVIVHLLIHKKNVVLHYYVASEVFFL